jgi:hypothetical protein
MDKLSTLEAEKLLEILKNRFEKNPSRHLGITWATVEKKLISSPEKLWSLQAMESTGGEPDVVDFIDGKAIFYDCSAESPVGRRSTCYDQAGMDSRKEFKPNDSAIEMARRMKVDILDEEKYRRLQQFGKFDQKTSSWLKTPEAIRKHGGAIFGDFRYEHVFIYHNGAQSYYAARGFRACLEV